MPKIEESTTEKLIHALKLIPKGQITTYKILGEKFNIHPRHVGRILHGNDYPDTYPCYKVVKSDGSIASGYAAGGPSEQIKRLKADNVPFKRDRVDLDKALYILENL
jgi:alkylated DNA nucleotide flippase Atl1